MRTLTEATLTAYAAADVIVDADTLRDMLRLAARLAAHEDDTADAIPHAVLAIARNGADWHGATVRALQSAARDRIDGWKVAAPEDPTDAATIDAVLTADADAAADARRKAERFERAMAAPDSAGRAMLRAVATDGLKRYREVGAVLAQASADAADAAAVRLPLRVAVLATAVGESRPRTAEQSARLRAAACLAWAAVSVAMGGADDLATRAAEAVAYVTRAPRPSRTGTPLAEGGMGSGAADAVPADLLTRQGPREVGAVSNRPQAVRTRKGATYTPAKAGHLPGVGEGIGYGATGTVATGMADLLASLTAGQVARKAAREDRAHTALAERQAMHCARPTVTGDTATCGCGGAVSTNGARALHRDGDAWAHPLTHCAAPTVTANGARCGCGRKRGALVADPFAPDAWAHRPQHRAARTASATH